MRNRVIAAVVALLLLPLAAVGELPKDVQQQLATSKFVYINRRAKTARSATPRRSGTCGTMAPSTSAPGRPPGASAVFRPAARRPRSR
jgi:hypothetical protein